MCQVLAFRRLQRIGFCALLESETLLQDVMPSIEELVSDQSQHVRAALGTQISGLAPILGKDEYDLQAPLALCSMLTFA